MNTLKTAVLMALLMGIMIAIGGALGGAKGAQLMLVISLVMDFATYWFCDKMVLAAYHAQEVTQEEAPELFNLVANLAANAKLPMPKVYVVEDASPNAFATGRNPSHAVVAVTTGILEVLNYEELSGVIAHELSHVKHRDILISTIAAAFASVISYAAQMAYWANIFRGGSDDEDEGGGLLGGLVTMIVAPLAAAIIQMAISRSREYDADKSGGEICGNPNYLAAALEKIEYYSRHIAPMPQATQATAHMFIINPLEGLGKTMANLFSTHPPTADRIAKLHMQASQMGIS